MVFSVFHLKNKLSKRKLDVRLGERSIVVICIYHPPNNSKISIQTFYNNVDTLLQHIIVKFRNPVLALASDYNIDFLKDNAINLDFTTILTSYDLISNINQPIWVTNFSQSCINILKHFPDHVNILETGLNLLALILKFEHTNWQFLPVSKFQSKNENLHKNPFKF